MYYYLNGLIEGTLLELFNYLIDNIYVCVDASVFKQCVGMGTDCAPVVANVFLFTYEYDFMKGLL